MKDYYKIIGVPPSAGQPEIKKAYRKLAYKYHPDINPDNTLAEAHFKEIQEAYSVLSVPAKKEKYDEERWLTGVGGHRNYRQEVTPVWLLGICVQLNTELAAMDTFRISHSALQAYILMILTDSHLGVLQQYGDTEANKAIIKEILKASTKLDIQYLEEVHNRLMILANGKSEMESAVRNQSLDRKKQAKQEQLLPWVVILVTLLLCVFMYFYAEWK